MPTLYPRVLGGSERVLFSIAAAPHCIRSGLRPPLPEELPSYHSQRGLHTLLTTRPPSSRASGCVLYEVTEFRADELFGVFRNEHARHAPISRPRAGARHQTGSHNGAAGVQETLRKYGDNCADEADRVYLVSWIEMLVLMREKLELDIDTVRERCWMRLLGWIRRDRIRLNLSMGRLNWTAWQGRHAVSHLFLPVEEMSTGR